MSRTTATAAYAALRDEGFLASRRGAGSWTRLPADPGVAPSRRRRPAADVIDLSLRGLRGSRGRAARARWRRRSPSCRGTCPARATTRPGLPVLRAAIAAHLTRARRCRRRRTRCWSPPAPSTRWTLLLRVLAGPGDRVLTEHPTYPAALDAIRAIGARPVPVSMLPGGWDLDMLAATLRQAAPRLAYLIADHQNPTGLTLPAADRERLVALARASRTPLVIDETIAGLHLDDGDAAPGPVGALDPRRGDRDHDSAR